MALRLAVRTALVWVLGTAVWVLLTPYADCLGQAPQGWSPPVNVSRSQTRSLNPAIAADPTGRVHVVWAEAMNADTPLGTGDVIMYSYAADGQWSDPADIIVPLGGPIVREMDLKGDSDSYLHIVWAGGYDAMLYHASAPAEHSRSARAWTSATLVDPAKTTAKTNGHSLIIDKWDTLHIAFATYDPDWQIYYTSSRDSGRNWSRPQRVSATIGGTIVSDVQLAVDGKGRCHIVWQEAPLETGWPTSAVLYTRSDDGGQTWTEPQRIDEKRPAYREDYGPGLIGIGTIGSDEVHLVWNGPPIGYRVHQSSVDGGTTWSPPAEIADRRQDFRYFSGKPMLLADAAGALQLVTCTQALRHATWKGTAWSIPDRVETGSCLNPRAAIGAGNTLHAVIYNDSDHEIWYSSLLIDAPEAAAKPYPRRGPTAALATVTTVSSVAATPTSTPTRSVSPVVSTPLDARISGTETWMQMVAAVVPVCLLVVGIAIFRLVRRRHSH
jgi:hypothetical protein